MPEKIKLNPFKDSEAVFATVARLLAGEGDLLAVEVLSGARPSFEWSTHDNWDGGFDIYDLLLEVKLGLFTRLSSEKQVLEQRILERIQAVSKGHTRDHVGSVTIVLEVTGGKDWRKKAQAWVGGDEALPESSALKTVDKDLIVRPEVFRIPDKPIDENQVAVMMPFAAEFDGTYEAIKRACKSVGLRALRADDLWENNTFMQDVFDIIFCSRIVIVDFSGRNPNVMYETGIAHTLGRQVVPITQSIDDVPSDLQHHRALQYLQNKEGLGTLDNGLRVRLGTITGREPK